MGGSDGKEADDDDDKRSDPIRRHERVSMWSTISDAVNGGWGATARMVAILAALEDQIRRSRNFESSLLLLSRL